MASDTWDRQLELAVDQILCGFSSRHVDKGPFAHEKVVLQSTKWQPRHLLKPASSCAELALRGVPAVEPARLRIQLPAAVCGVERVAGKPV